MEINISNFMISGEEYNRYEKRIIRYRPEVTRVEEWTSAEIGVGAAIAIGNQGEKGYRALLVMKVSNIKPMRNILLVLEEKDEKSP